MDVLLTSVKSYFALDDLENIEIFWRTPDESIDNVLQVLILLNDAFVTCKLNKGEIFPKDVDHLGHVIPTGRLDKHERNMVQT